MSETENEINNDEKTYLFGAKYLRLPRDEEGRKRLAEREIVVPEELGTQWDYHSTSRTDVRRLDRGRRDVWRLMDALKWKSINKDEEGNYTRELKTTTEMLEKHFGNEIYSAMKTLWMLGGRRGNGNIIITHSNKYDSWTDSMRVVSHLNRQTYSDASEHSRKNAFVINYDAVCEIWNDNKNRWLDNKNNLESRNASIRNLQQVMATIDRLKSDIHSLKKKGEALNDCPTVNKEDLVLYALHKFESGMTRGITGDYWDRNEVGKKAHEAAMRLDAVDSIIRRGLPSLNNECKITIENLNDAIAFVNSEPDAKYERAYGGGTWVEADVPKFSQIALLMEQRDELKRDVESRLNDYKGMVLRVFTGDEEE